jgi:hypothetical protein
MITQRHLHSVGGYANIDFKDCTYTGLNEPVGGFKVHDYSPGAMSKVIGK